MPTPAKRPLQPEDSYLLRMVFDPQVSPDGRRVAYVVRTSDRESDERRMSIWVAPMDGRTPARRVRGARTLADRSRPLMVAVTGG